MGTNLGTLRTFGYTLRDFSVRKHVFQHKKSIMKATAFLRKVKLTDGTQNGVIYFRVRDGKKDFRLASSLTINPEYWDASVHRLCFMQGR
jgi:hypothetical protein